MANENKTAALLCPVCHAALSLTPDGKSFKCQSGHCYDVAKSGYVNLLPPEGHGRHGDDKLMVNARTAFLDRGFYNPLADTVAAQAVKYAPQGAVTLVDAGCGEGKYTADVTRLLRENGRAVDAIGIDISKEALRAAERRLPQLRAVAAGTNAMPLEDGAAAVLLNIFSPFFAEEFARVLGQDGVLIRVIPGERHLWELKAIVYDVPRENAVPDLSAQGLAVVDTIPLTYTVTLPTHDDIMNLFMMTPYYYKTGIADQAKTKDLETLNVTFSFIVVVYKKVS